MKAQIPELALQVVTLERYNDQLAAVLAVPCQLCLFEYEFAHVDDLRAYKRRGWAYGCTCMK